MFSLYASEWRRLLEGFDAAPRAALARVAQSHNEILAQHFYRVMLKDETAAGMLSHEQVHTRLMASMRQWILPGLGCPA